MQGHLKSEVVTVCFILALAAGGTGSLKSIVLAQQPGTSPPAAPASTGAGPAASATPAPAASAGPANPSPSPLGSTNGTPALSGVAISPSEVDFGEQPLSCQIARNIAITAGKDGAKLTFVSTNGDFAPSPVNCQLAPGETCAVTITFAPKHPGHTSGQLTIIKDANSSARFVLLSGVGVLSASSAPGPLGINGWWISFLAVLILVGLYLAALILVRWNMVARPARRLLLVQVEGVRGELNSLELTSPAGQIAAKQIQALLAKAAEQAPEHARVRLLDLLFWNRGQEIAGWSYVHEAEQLMANILPEAALAVRLRIAAKNLSSLCAGAQTASDTDLAVTITTELENSDPARLPIRRALLSEALNRVFGVRDDGFSTLMSWYNRTMWLIGCGLLLIIALAAALDHSVLFLMGAAGGLLSRLARAFHSKDMPTDYGSSWVPLFLSPVAGALAGWTGILLIILGKELNIFGPGITVDWCNSYTPIALALAFVLGFSERAFDQILSGLEQKLTPTNLPTSNSPNQQPGPPSPKPQVPAPIKISGIDKTQGPLGGGFPVNISGTGFSSAATVSFGGAPATNVTVSAGGTTLTATVPKGSQAIPVDVAVKNPDGGTDTLRGGFTYKQ